MSLRKTLCGAAATALAVAAILSARPAAAQTGEEQIDHYAVTVDIANDGRLHVAETIDYDFGTTSHHGIYRYIPVRFHYDQKYDRIYPVSNIHVSGSAGTPTNVKLSDDSTYKVIRVGDPHQTITGRHQYTISYDVRGALNHFSDHDELYWNMLPTRWNPPVRMRAVESVVRFPVAVTKIACFAGPEHSTLPCTSAVGDGTTDARFTADELGPGSGMTVVAAVPPGVIRGVGPVLDERWSPARAFAITPATGGVAGVLTLLIVGLLGRMLFRHGRDRRLVAGGEEPRPLFDKAGGPVLYRPPDGLRPAQVGVLIDESADPLDVTASIVDLAVRGYLKIEQIPDKGLFSKGDWRLTQLKGDDAALQPYERRLRDALFHGGDDTVLLSELRHHFYSDLKKIQDDLYDDCVAQKWFMRRPDQTRGLWLALGLVVAVIGVAVVALVAWTSHAGFAVLPLVLAGLIILAAHNRMPARTAAGAQTLDEIVGFRRFVTTAETERMQFAEEEGIFAKYLPYAIIFGATKQWAKRFAGLGADSPAMSGMGWYISPYAFNPIGFSDSMHDFTITTAGTIVSTPPSASGGSGFGGFSGGGGGGGGGGSW